LGEGGWGGGKRVLKNEEEAGRYRRERGRGTNLKGGKGGKKKTVLDARKKKKTRVVDDACSTDTGSEGGGGGGGAKTGMVSAARGKGRGVFKGPTGKTVGGRETGVL